MTILSDLQVCIENQIQVNYCIQKSGDLQGVGRPKASGPATAAQPPAGSQNENDDTSNIWQGAVPIGVLDTSRPDELVDAILSNVDPGMIADVLLKKAQSGNQQASAALLKVLDNVSNSGFLLQEDQEGAFEEPSAKRERKKEDRPRVSSADAGDKTFKRRHAILRMSLSRVDATQQEIRRSVARHFKQFALEDPMMTAEVCYYP
jgi:hypothetical protein